MQRIWRSLCGPRVLRLWVMCRNPDSIACGVGDRRCPVGDRRCPVDDRLRDDVVVLEVGEAVIDAVYLESHCGASGAYGSSTSCAAALPVSCLWRNRACDVGRPAEERRVPGNGGLDVNDREILRICGWASWMVILPVDLSSDRSTIVSTPGGPYLVRPADRGEAPRAPRCSAPSTVMRDSGRVRAHAAR